MRITVDKARRRLVLRQGRRELYRCRCHLGPLPTGAKNREGDGRTPEGMYYVCSRNPQSKYHRALGISYPNSADAARARRSGLIDGETYESICRAERRRMRPAWDTPMGGWIMIHGEPHDGRDPDGDWTAGCIAVSDRDMDALFAMCALGVRVVIRP